MTYLWSLGIWCTMKGRNIFLPSKKGRKKKEQEKQLFKIQNIILFFALAGSQCTLSRLPRAPETFLRTDLRAGWCHLWNDLNGGAEMPGSIKIFCGLWGRNFLRKEFLSLPSALTVCFWYKAIPLSIKAPWVNLTDLPKIPHNCNFANVFLRMSVINF